MNFRLCLLASCFNSYFEGNYDIIFRSRSRITEEKDNLLVYDCFFEGLSQSAIYYYGSTINLVVCDCMFYSCLSSLNGGGIYFSCSNGGIVLDRVCGFQCYSTSSSSSYGQFCNTLTGDNIHEYHYVSIRSCPSTGSSRYCSLWIGNGNQKLYSVNQSMNSCYCVASFQSLFSQSLQSQFCTVSNNIAIDNQIINCHGGANRQIKYCNVVHNVSPQVGIVFIWEGAACVMDQCVFLSNTGTLFNIGSGTLQIKNSFITHSGTTTVNSVILSNNTKAISSYSVSYFETNQCKAFCSIGHRVCIQTNARFNKITQFYFVIVLISIMGE